ncbi:MAG: hypothetical protein BWY58_00061 [Chloroflexi bacterium ADurb.Bin344]|nr:MAG: hypothetical protein BWY58_00061 [Chloroflexi bacterium ADurb.Bin344]
MFKHYESHIIDAVDKGDLPMTVFQRWSYKIHMMFCSTCKNALADVHQNDEIMRDIKSHLNAWDAKYKDESQSTRSSNVG